MATQPYISLANRLRRDIETGVYGTEGGLPGAAALSKFHALSEVTVRKALAILEGERLIVSRDRSFFVNKIAYVMTQYIPPVLIRSQEQGRKGYAKNIAPIEKGNLPVCLAEKLQLPQSVTTTIRTYVSGEIADDGTERPLQLFRHYYILPVSDEQIARMEADPTSDVMWEDAPSQMASRDELTPRLPAQDEADALKVPVTTPVNSLFVTIRDLGGKLLLVQEITLAPGVTLIYDYSFENRFK